MANRVAIVGAGLAGRLLALELAWRDWQVTLYEKDDASGRQSCSWTGAGMIAPYCEQESAEPLICALGLRSLELWPQFLAKLPRPVFYQADGSLVVAHAHDLPELGRLQREVESRGTGPEAMQQLAGPQIAEIEPELADRFHRGLFFPHEAQLDNWQLLEVTTEVLSELGVQWHCDTTVSQIRPGSLTVGDQTHEYPLVIDTRGLGAQDSLPKLRGVRGELVHVIAPEVKLRRPVRMMHPRYPLYIVPRPDDRYVIGATKIESDDLSPVSVRGLLELLSAAYALHPGFAEARLLETNAHCRPALPHNLPLVHLTDGLIRLNGMFRHGFLLAPALVEGVLAHLNGQPLSTEMTEVVRLADTAGGWTNPEARP